MKVFMDLLVNQMEIIWMKFLWRSWWWGIWNGKKQ